MSKLKALRTCRSPFVQNLPELLSITLHPQSIKNARRTVSVNILYDNSSVRDDWIELGIPRDLGGHLQRDVKQFATEKPFRGPVVAPALPVRTPVLKVVLKVVLNLTMDGIQTYWLR